MNSQQKQSSSFVRADQAKIEKQVLAAYDDARKAINQELQALYAIELSDIPKADRYNHMIKQGRLEDLLKDIDGLYNAQSVKAGRLTAESSSLGVNNSYYLQQFISKWFSPRAGIDLDFTTMPANLANLSVTGNLAVQETITQNVINTFGAMENYVPADGTTLSALLVNNRRQEIAKINRTITSGLLQGKGYRQMVSDVAAIIGTATDTGATGAKASAIRIIRTEGNRTLNAGAYANSQAISAQGLSIKRVWVATLDSRTRERHTALDGKSVGVDEPFISGDETAMYPGEFPSAAQSVNCRCTTIDAIDGIPPQARSGVNPNTGVVEIFDWQSYPEWAESQGLKKNANGKWS